MVSWSNGTFVGLLGYRTNGTMTGSPLSSNQQFIRYRKAPSGATKDFIQLLHICSSSPQDLHTDLMAFLLKDSKVDTESSFLTLETAAAQQKQFLPSAQYFQYKNILIKLLKLQYRSKANNCLYQSSL